MDNDFNLFTGDCLDVLKVLPDNYVQTCITSPPYFHQRNYQHDNQLGHEDKLFQYTYQLNIVFNEVWRVLKPDGTLWLNLGDKYENGQLLGVPWKVVFQLQDAGWILRSDIIWSKKNTLPENVTNRPTRAHEYLFLFSKQKDYYYNADAIREPYSDVSINRMTKYKFNSVNPDRTDFGKDSFHKPNPLGKNKRDVWVLPTSNYKGAHFATFPLKLVEPCVLAGSKEGDIVLDPFSGAGTTGVVALQHNRKYIGIDINESYNSLAANRFSELFEYTSS
jgi:DNA modification methylase